MTSLLLYQRRLTGFGNARYTKQYGFAVSFERFVGAGLIEVIGS
ncbi:MAG: hypothetical protein ACJAZW_000987 [Maritalea sp.]|jgi:hypothetical protein